MDRNNVELIILISLGLSTNVALGNWMLLAMPSAAPISLEMDPKNYKTECLQLTYLTPRQRELCTLGRNMIKVVGKGAQLGLKECGNQFKSRHWNCSTSFNTLVSRIANGQTQGHVGKSKWGKRGGSNNVKDSKDIRKTNQRNETIKLISLRDLSRFQSDAPSDDVGDVLGGILKYHTREKAYVHAISAAGVAFSVTRSCTAGHLPACSCDNQVASRKTKNEKKGSWEWGGCSEDVGYGARISEDFVDAHELERPSVDVLRGVEGNPAPQLMNLHNNEAGRRALRQNVKLMCKCHGVSGSCTTKVCWRRLGDFSKVGQILYRKFDGAVRVRFSKQRHKLKPAIQGHQKPRKRDLVYLEESPDYCKIDEKQGLYGTVGRRCNLTSYGIDNCRVLCCGRGYKTVTEKSEEDCECKFVWCCQVKCSKCVSVRHEHYCL